MTAQSRSAALKACAVGSALAMSALLGACDSGPAASSGPGSAGEVEPEAVQKVKELSADLDTIGISDPLLKMPIGAKVDILVVGDPYTTAVANTVKEVGSKLGLEVTLVEAGFTADAISRAWTTAVNDNPDLVIAAGFPTTMYRAQLQQLRDQGGKYLAYSLGVEGTPDGVDVQLHDAAEYQRLGADLADWVAVDSNGGANALFYGAPDIETVNAIERGYTSRLEEVCPACKSKTVDVSISDIGTNLPGQLVSALQRDPDVNYIVASIADMYTGMAQALRQADLQDRVRAVTLNGNTDTLKEIQQDGVLRAELDTSPTMFGYRIADAAARILTGQTVPIADDPAKFNTFSNIDFDVTKPWVGYEGFEEDYENLWAGAK